jgi:tetratricopeptide (TPR) repeat protein
MDDAATYLKARGLVHEAVPFAQWALTVGEQVLGPNHPRTATSLNNLALLYNNQGDSAKAEPLYQRALAIYEQVLGPTIPTLLLSETTMQDQGRKSEAGGRTGTLYPKDLVGVLD